MNIEQIQKQIKEALDLAIPLFNGVREDAEDWMNTPTSLCFGDSPIETIYAGEGEAVIEWLKVRSSKSTGSAF